MAEVGRSSSAISPSLLANITKKRSREAHERFRLGMGEWTESSEGSSSESENLEAPSKKTLKFDRARKRKQFKEKAVESDKENCWHFVDETREEGSGKKFVCKNTFTSTKWAVSNVQLSPPLS